MTPTRMLLAAALLTGGCVSDHFAPLRGDWDAFEAIPIDDGVDGRAVALPLVYELEAADGSDALSTETIAAHIDDSNVLTVSQSITWVAAGQSPIIESCDQVGELTMNEDGSFQALLPEQALNETSICPEADTTCTLDDDGLMMSCNMIYTDISAAFQDTHLEGIRVSFRPQGWEDTAAL